MQDKNKVYTVTESKTVDDKAIISTEYSEKLYGTPASGIEAIGNVYTVTRVKESDIITSIRQTYRVDKSKVSLVGFTAEDKNNVKGYITVTDVWEVNLASGNIPDEAATSTIYAYKVKEGDKLINYQDTYLFKTLDARQKTYYTKKDTLKGAGTSVQVTENYIGSDAGILDSFSYSYWDNVTDSLVPGSLKVTENYIDINTNHVIDTEDLG